MKWHLLLSCIKNYCTVDMVSMADECSPIQMAEMCDSSKIPCCRIRSNFERKAVDLDVLVLDFVVAHVFEDGCCFIVPDSVKTEETALGNVENRQQVQD